MAKIQITQTRSRIHCTKRQKATLDALGLKKLNRTVEHDKSPAILGMVRNVAHLVIVVEEV